MVSETAPRYFRAFAWAKLVKFWTSSRSADLAGLVPSNLRLDQKGLSAQLQRTKTSGPGKKVKWLPVFVDISATFAKSIGFAIWSAADMSFARDYLIPLPSQDLQSCKAVFADYTAVSALSKLLYQELRLPLWVHGTWVLSDSKLVIALACVRAWTEHSERCWLTSCAALLGVSRERREFLGRWRVFSSGDEYALSPNFSVRWSSVC